MISVAIDGPAGAGKSTLSREAARAFGLLHVDTGALYRAVGLYALRKGIDPAGSEQVEPLLPDIRLSLDFGEDGQRVFLNGEDVSEAIRLPEASMAASAVSAIPGVRAFLLETQRRLAREHGVVMDGRDIGTVVLPDATVKIFLTADASERARRRFNELREKGLECDYDTLLAEVRQRDYNDSHRAAAPLRAAPDAVTVDTTGLSFEQSLGRIKQVINDGLEQAGAV